MRFSAILLALASSAFALQERNIVGLFPESQIASTVTLEADVAGPTSVVAASAAPGNGTVIASVAAASPVNPATSTAAAAVAATTAAQGQAAAAASQAPQGASANAQVFAGIGETGNGDACACDCLCGAAQVPSNVGVNNFGGFVGMLPSPAAMSAA